MSFVSDTAGKDDFAHAPKFRQQSKYGLRIDSCSQMVQPANMRIKSSIGISALMLVTLTALTGCLTWESTPQSDPITVYPAGIVKRVNFAEKYLVFEASHSFDAGKVLTVIREGSPVGKVRVLAFKRKRIQSADILEGVPEPGDVLEGPPPAQPQHREHGQRGGLRPQDSRAQ